MAKILLLNGPNLNLLGTREPEVYGAATLASIVENLTEEAALLHHELSHFQSNHEGELIDRVHDTLADGTEFILFNPGAFTHTSVALRDALSGVSKPFIELHLSNVHARESFRQHSFLAPIAAGVITGFGVHSYSLALKAADHYLNNNL